MKLHEDWGSTPAAIDNCLTVAEEYDIQVSFSSPESYKKKFFFCFKFCIDSHPFLCMMIWQVNIHTDTLNESGFVEHTIAAFKGRTIHTYHRYYFHAYYGICFSIFFEFQHIIRPLDNQYCSHNSKIPSFKMPRDIDFACKENVLSCCPLC